MKRSLAIIAIAMILFGALTAIISEIPKEEVLYDRSFVVIPNAHYYQAFRFSPNVKLDINFEVNGGAVDFMVLEDEEFKNYEASKGYTQYTGISSPSVTSVVTTWKTPPNESHIYFVWNNDDSSDKTVDVIFTIHETTLSSTVTVLGFFSFFAGIAVFSFAVRGFTPECSRSVRAHIMVSYIFAVLGGLIGLLLGAMLLVRKDTVDQLHGTERFYGKVIIAISITALLVFAFYGYFAQSF